MSSVNRDQSLMSKTKSRQISDMAYHSTKKGRAVLKSRIFQRLGVFPSTDDALEKSLNSPHQSVSSTRRQLVKQGLVEASGKLRITRNGRMAQVWQLTKAGMEIWKKNNND